jgi:hypothetical protein
MSSNHGSKAAHHAKENNSPVARRFDGRTHHASIPAAVNGP